MVGDDSLILENQLSFIMYVCSKETIKYYKAYLQKFDLTYTQYITMLVLWKNDNILVNELGKSLYLDSGTVTPLLKKLEAKGFIERRRDNDDERNVFVTVTTQGYKLKEKVRNIPQIVLDDTGVSRDDANDILISLKSVLNSLERNKVMN